MRPNKHHRDLIAFVEREFGSTAIVVPGTGRHHRLQFDYEGKQFSFPVGAHNNNKASILRNTTGSLRRLVTGKGDGRCYKNSAA